MRRAAALLLAAGALAAAGCGDSPEDNARDAGEQIGGDLYALQNATSADQARQEVADLRAQMQDVRDDLPGDFSARVAAIGDQLRADLQSADDPAARRAAFLDALSSLDALASDTNSVVNEFSRGVRQGYQDAAD